MQESAAPVLPGETLDAKYRVERVIGRGGMGVVVAARHLQLDERVAIKFLASEASEPTTGQIERFLREARAAAKVRGEHVCRVFDVGRLETGEPYIVMEYLEGIDLGRKLEREGRQPAAQVVGWIVEACDALADAHALGIVHRDLKPANIFLANRADGSTCAKVLDFGISKLTSAETMTKTAANMGSPVYMSPEQMESAHEVDARSDVWSLGVVLYELLSGAPPFEAESMIQLAVKVREKEPPPLAAEIPEGLARVVSRCLAKKADDRYPSAAALVAALAPFAPADVAALVARATKRTVGPISETKLPPTVAVEAKSGTFAPLQSTRAVAMSTRKWPLPLAAVLIIAITAVTTRALTSRSAASSPPPSSSVVTTEVPTVVASSSASAIPIPILQTAPTASVTSATRAPPTVVTVVRSHVDTRPTASAVVSSAAPVVSAPPPVPERKKRTLDRDDP